MFTINYAFGSLSNRFLRSVANERKLKYLGLKMVFLAKLSSSCEDFAFNNKEFV